MVGPGDADLLPQAVLRQIGDKLYEKRKVAALEVEQIMRSLVARADDARIAAVLDKIVSDFSFSNQPNARKGALLCLAAATVGLGAPQESHLLRIVPPVLRSFTDPDPRVRYYACEAMYNIAKVAREGFIIFFNEVFDALFRLCADAEGDVKNAVAFLDNLVKDIVAATPAFDLAPLVPKLRDYLRVVNPFKRQFLIAWIAVLASVPDLDMLGALPQLLEGLLAMLSDPNREIRVAAHKTLMEFLVEVQAAAPLVDFPRLAATLVEAAASDDEFTRLTALKWLKVFISLAAPALAPQFASLLGALLPNMAHSSKDIAQVAAEANAAMLALQPSPGGVALVPLPMLEALRRELRAEAEATRLAALQWVAFLLRHEEAAVFGQLPPLLTALLDALAAPSEPVLLQALAVLGSIAAHPHHFRQVLVSLLDRFRGPLRVALLQRGGELTVRRLCAALGPAKVYTELAAILGAEQDLEFAADMVQALNLILLTKPEVSMLRDALRSAAVDPAGAQLFAAIYSCWSQSAAAILSLCFLSGAYGHACDVVAALAGLPIGRETLLQIDRLVGLLESPNFAFLRLQLLAPRQHPDLVRSMYALLMLLPQGKAFDVLNRRLGAVPLHALMHLDEPAVPPAGTIPIPMSSGGASASHASRSKDAEAAAPGGSGRAAEAGAAPHQQEDSGEGSVSGPPPVAAPEPATAEGRGQWAPFGDLLRQFVAKQRQQLEREDEGALEAGKPPASAAAPAVAGGSSGGG